MTQKSVYPAPIPLIAALPATTPFVGPEAIERKRQKPFIARLGANENGFGPAPSVIKAIHDHSQDIWKYGDPENYDLQQALAKFYGLPADHLTIGAGVDALLGLIVRQYIEPNDIVINSLGGYPTFNYHVKAYGGQLVNVPYHDNHSHLAALAEAAIQNKAKIVYLSNPDNPLGTWHDAAAIEAFIASIPEDILIILDEAYGECAPQGTLPPINRLWPNVLRTRTFSKAYGLAGMRCGMVIGNPFAIAQFDKIRDHFAVGLLTQKAALAALEDQAALQDTIKKIANARERIVQIVAQSGFSCLPSATNFVAIDCEHADFAQILLLQLEAAGIFIRKPMAAGLDHFIRVSVGPNKELDFLEEHFSQCVKAARG